MGFLAVLEYTEEQVLFHGKQSKAFMTLRTILIKFLKIVNLWTKPTEKKNYATSINLGLDKTAAQ